MTLHIAVLVAGLFFLTWSADKLIDAASGVAHKLGISPLLVGMTIVAMGTSAPEAVVSLSASLNGARDMVVGNVFGSNIANIALVMGVTALIAPIPVSLPVVKKELPLMLLATGMAGYVVFNGSIDLADAVVMMILLAATLWWIFRTDKEALLPEVPTVIEKSALMTIFWILFSFVVLISSAHALVWSASQIAFTLGVSELVVGLTIVAVGTSLPELAASVMSVLKRQHDIAIGSILGSNILNILLVLAIPGFLSPGGVSPIAIQRDYPVLLGVSLLFALLLIWKRHGALNRWMGGALLATYLGYLLVIATASA